MAEGSVHEWKARADCGGLTGHGEDFSSCSKSDGRVRTWKWHGPMYVLKDHSGCRAGNRLGDDAE